MKGSKAVSFLIIVSAFIITSCDLFVTEEDKKEPNYGPNSGPLSGTVSITPPDPSLGDTLTAVTSVVVDGYLEYKWECSDTGNGQWEETGGYRDTYPLQWIDEGGKYFRVTVSQYGRGSLTSKAVYVGIRPLAGSVSINKNAVEGETLTADTGSLEGFGSISYQWERAETADTADWTTIWEGTGTNVYNEYIVKSEDVGKYIRLTVTRSLNSDSITSEATAAVAFKISGNAFLSHNLSPYHSHYYFIESGSYQWERADTADGEWIAIEGEYTSSLWYSLGEADLGKYIRLTITRADNTRIYSEVVGPILLPSLTGTVSISETVNIGETLNADTSGLGLWGGGDISYQWERWDEVNNTSENIGDTPAYTVVRADLGKQLQVTVTRSGNSGSISSNRTNTITLAPLSGVVYFRGDLIEDETLTAYTEDYLGGSGEITYQWEIRPSASSGSWTIIGSNSPTYTIADADVGKYIRLTVTRADNTGSVSSQAARISDSLIGTVSISGDTFVGATLTAHPSLKGSGTISYQWLSGGASVGGNSPTYTIAVADNGKTITVRVSRVGRSGNVESPPTAQVYKRPLTGTVSISGTVAVGESLTAATGSLGGSGTISYQWQAGDTANGPWTNISNASNYTPALAQEGRYIRLTVTRTDNADSVSSEALGPVIKLPLTGTVSISGIAAVDQTLTVNISNLGGSGTSTYQWERADAATGPWAAIGSNSSYKLVGDDLGKYIRLTVTRANNAGSVSSQATAAVDLPRLTGTVTINGAAAVEQTLTADTSNLGGSGTITYQWLRASSTDGPWTDVVGSDSPYLLTSADLWKYIRLTVSRADNSGSVSRTTSAVGPPLLDGTVSISGTARAGETLTAVTTSLGGSGAITYRWQRGDTADASTWTTIGTNSATYIPVATDAGRYIRLTVSRADNSGDVFSSATSAVTVAAISGSVSIIGTAKVGNTLSAGIGDLKGVITYQWYSSASGTVGGNSAYYTPVKADVGANIRVIVSSNYYTGTLTSNATSAVTIDPLTGSIRITRDLNNPTLRVNTDNLGGSGTITYKWESSMSLTLLLGGLGENLGSGSTYTYNTTQMLHYIRVTVTRANNDGTVSDTYYVSIF